MEGGWRAGCIAFLCVLVCVPIVRTICRRWRLYDFSEPLKMHSCPIPRLGGVGIALGLTAGIVLGNRGISQHIGLWLAAFGVIWIAGLVDDVRGLSPFFKLAAQMGSGILLWTAGWRLPFVAPTIFHLAVICAIVVLFVNAFNFLDGSDGLASGVTAVIGGAYIAAYSYGTSANRFGLAVAGSLLGACLGFLIFNFPPAKIFMGDSGSTILGFCVAFLGIDFVARASSQAGAMKWLFPIFVAAVPLADGILVVLGRVRRGSSPFAGDRRHYYDLLMARGWSSRTVALGTCALTALLSVAGWWMMRGLRPHGFALAGIAAGILLVGLNRLPWVAHKNAPRR